MGTHGERFHWGEATWLGSYWTNVCRCGGRRESVNKERNYEASQASGGMAGNLVWSNHRGCSEEVVTVNYKGSGRGNVRVSNAWQGGSLFYLHISVFRWIKCWCWLLTDGGVETELYMHFTISLPSQLRGHSQENRYWYCLSQKLSTLLSVKYFIKCQPYERVLLLFPFCRCGNWSTEPERTGEIMISLWTFSQFHAHKKHGLTWSRERRSAHRLMPICNSEPCDED